MRISVRRLAFGAVIGAIYAVLTMVLSPLSYGPIQLRISEALCVLPYFLPSSAWGLFIGCAIANLLSAAGIADVVLGSLTTFVSALLIAALGRHHGSKVIACLIPVLLNAAIVGAVLSRVGTVPEAFFPAWGLCALEVGIGEALVLFGVGLPMLLFLPRTRFFSIIRALYARENF